jgi:apolipoprotein N-acyltransferase
MIRISMARRGPDKVTLWSFVSGLLLALAFPRVDLAALAWMALVPLFLVMPARPFRSGFTAGLGFFGLVLYWLNIVMTTYGRMNPVFSVAAYLLLVCYLSLFFGTATWAACRIREKSGLSPVLTLPVLWVALEFLRSFLFSGFPWATLGYSQSARLSLIQSADIFGVYGISFLLILVNAVLAEAVGGLRSGDLRKLPRLGLAAAVILFSLNLGYGYWRLGQDLDARKESLQTALIQGNIDQSVKWDPAFQKTTVDLYRDLSLAADSRNSVNLLVWPESATPFYFQDGGPLASEVDAVPRRTDAFLLFGSPAYQLDNRTYRYLNSAFLLSPAGEILGRSDKVHLVPFGEYVPLGRFLPFISKLVSGIGDFSPGRISPLPLDGHRIGVLVCFEGIFPELAREYVREGSDLLVNITNDAWFGRSSAPFQHLAMTRFRAVENRVWVARAANTGISAYIAPSGRITQESAIFKTLYLDGKVGLGARPFLYTHIGDIFPILFLALGGIWLVRTRRRF